LEPLNLHKNFLFMTSQKDSVLNVKTDQIVGIFDTARFKKDYPAKPTKINKEKKPILDL